MDEDVVIEGQAIWRWDRPLPLVVSLGGLTRTGLFLFMEQQVETILEKGEGKWTIGNESGMVTALKF